MDSNRIQGKFFLFFTDFFTFSLREHVRNVKFIDTIIPIVQDMFENAFSDNSTTYIFTADHGMTNWGSHGGSSAHETETPLIIWGAGIQNNRKKVKDINQVDIAPLISGLLGINYPVNSIVNNNF